ncbi:MAG: hypothetical protein ACI4MQ_07140 [Candidatus Coproplasma sp.]
MKRLLDKIKIEQAVIESNKERVESFNREHCVTKDTEIIIVGTITPPKACGYFYTSPYNCIYGYIDEVRNTGLKELKRKLKTHSTAKDEIVATLTQQKIAFLDVMEKVIRIKGSSADDDIQNFCLDYNAFEQVFGDLLVNKGVKIICNSRLAQAGYNRIKDGLKIKGVNLPDSIYVSQVRRLQKQYKKDWLEVLKAA